MKHLMCRAALALVLASANALAQQPIVIMATGRVQVYDITPDEQAALRKALLPVHKEMESRIGKQWIEAVHKEAATVGVRY